MGTVKHNNFSTIAYFVKPFSNIFSFDYSCSARNFTELKEMCFFLWSFPQTSLYKTICVKEKIIYWPSAKSKNDQSAKQIYVNYEKTPAKISFHEK